MSGLELLCWTVGIKAAATAQRDTNARAPRPSVATLRSEEHVVRRTAVERRVEVNEVDRFIGDGAPQNVEIVAVVEEVAAHAVRLSFASVGR